MHSLSIILALGNAATMCMFAAAYASKAESKRRMVPIEVRSRTAFRGETYRR